MKETEERRGLTLIKKGKRGLVQLVFSRMGLIFLLLLLQVMVLFSFFQWFSDILPYFYGGTVLFSAGMVLYLINSNVDPTAKITWLIIVMLLPVFGVLLYWYVDSEIGHRALQARIAQLIEQTKGSIPQDSDTLEAFAQKDPGAASLVRYIGNTGDYPVYTNTEVTYFPLGQDKWEEMLVQLKQAKHFIFLEYFIVDEGVMWGTILEILAEKVKEGVEVRMMYDGSCEFTTLPHDYPKKLKALGIQCKMFAPISPFLSTHYNYRDHRKILVIDGEIAFTGGVNLADEYINHITKYGYWKDTAIMLRGNAVKSFTLMFLQLWNIDEKKPEFSKYLREASGPVCPAEGFVIPYGDVPLDKDRVGERIYMDILNRSTRYVHIMTPYLILDGEMETALKFAAERGVDVTLILPGIPDKKSAYALAKTYYSTLLDSGVKIYEYTPGFVHAKVFVSDDKEAVVGTINLDYRSLYHHFECAAYLYGVECIGEIEEDFENTLQQCSQVTRETIKKERFKTKATGFLLKAIAPLM